MRPPPKYPTLHSRSAAILLRIFSPHHHAEVITKNLNIPHSLTLDRFLLYLPQGVFSDGFLTAVGPPSIPVMC